MIKNRADAFAHDMCKELSGLSEAKRARIEWQCRGPLRTGHECVDLTGYVSGKPRFLIEVELRRYAPVGNIVKIWKWVDRGLLKGKLTVIQAFSKGYDRKLDNRRENAKFIGERMEKLTGVKYIAYDFRYRPRKKGKRGGGARQKQARRLASQIIGLLKI
jgi:hypothetical protein